MNQRSNEQLNRIVVKIGSSTLTSPDGALDVAFFSDLARQIAAVREQGIQVVLVTSGAIRAGSARLALRDKPRTMPEKQAAAAVGQGLLMQAYSDAFAAHGMTAGQVLLVRTDFQDRRRYVNARNTLNALLAYGAVPVINENDTVAVDEIKVGDNDTLSSLVAAAVDADLLLLLSDVPGLLRESGEVISEVREVGPDIIELASGASGEFGTGGMRTKIEAAQIAATCGTVTVIAYGRELDVVTRVAAGEHLGTRFCCKRSKLAGRKRWIAFGRRLKGTIIVNEGAKGMLVHSGTSLLPVGIIGVSGSFESGDLVAVADESGERIARGVVNYSAEEVGRIKGRHSSEIEHVLGYRDFDEVIHRDNLVLGV